MVAAERLVEGDHVSVGCLSVKLGIRHVLDFVRKPSINHKRILPCETPFHRGLSIVSTNELKIGRTDEGRSIRDNAGNLANIKFLVGIGLSLESSGVLLSPAPQLTLPVAHVVPIHSL